MTKYWKKYVLLMSNTILKDYCPRKSDSFLKALFQINMFCGNLDIEEKINQGNLNADSELFYICLGFTQTATECATVHNVL